LLALGTSTTSSSSSSNQRSLLQQELSAASLAVAAAEKLAASGTGFHAVLPGSGGSVQEVQREAGKDGNASSAGDR
jgi:hypothetical protein